MENYSITQLFSGLENYEHQEIYIEKSSAEKEIQIIADLLDKNILILKYSADVSNLNEEETIDWVRSLDITNDRVLAFWLFDKEGVEIDMKIFFNHLSSLWFPSSDDIWITSSERTWLLELDHEEIFTFYITTN